MSLLRDQDTGHLVGIEQPPTAAPAEHADFPKWVTPDPSHVVTGQGGHLSVAGFEHSIDRAGNLLVLVKDETEEADALAPKSDKTRLRLVPDAPDDTSGGEPLSPLWPKPSEGGPDAAPAAPVASEAIEAAEPASADPAPVAPTEPVATIPGEPDESDFY